MSEARERTAAAERFRKFFNETTACLTGAPVELVPQGAHRRLLRLCCELRSRAGDGYRLSLEQTFTTGPHAKHGMKASTLSYAYSLEFEGGELLSYHWHPEIGGITWPHIHAAQCNVIISGKPFGRLHLPTGRVSIERLVWLLIKDFDVPPALGHDECKLVLERNEQLFGRFKSW